MKRKFVMPKIQYVKLIPEEVVARGCWSCSASGYNFC
jgi:hypothetical protein